MFSAKKRSSNTEGRLEQVRCKFWRRKGRLICSRLNANARFSRVQRLVFLNVEPEELISFLLPESADCRADEQLLNVVVSVVEILVEIFEEISMHLAGWHPQR